MINKNNIKEEIKSIYEEDIKILSSEDIEKIFLRMLKGDIEK